MLMGHISDGASELSARSRASRVAPDEGGDIRIKLGTNSYEGRGGAPTYEVVFVLGFGVAELASAKKLFLGRGQTFNLSAVRAYPSQLATTCVGIYANPHHAFTDIYAVLNFICVFAYIYCVYVSLYAKKNLPSWALKKSKCGG
jgi:hypothetical protein